MNRLFIVVLICYLASSVKASCPNATEILPCTCEIKFEKITVRCDAALTEDEIENAFKANFTQKNLHRFFLEDNLNIMKLTKNVFGDITFEEIHIIASNIESYSEAFISGQLDTLKIFDNMDTKVSGNDSFPFHLIPKMKVLTEIFYDRSLVTEFPTIESDSLVNINFDDNRITSVKDMKNCPKLQTISLRFNQIQNISSTTFQGLPELQRIRLEYNKINSLKAGIFANFSWVHIIHLNGNPIETIEKGAFSNLPKLDTLYLDHIKTSSIPEGFTSECPALSRLFLRYGTLSDMGHNAVTYPDIDRIYLNGNKFTTLKNNQFSKKLTGAIIYLDNNMISSMDKDAFAGVKSNTIYLNDNQIETLDEQWLKPILDNNNTVDISNNPLTCHCDAVWIFDNSTNYYDHLTSLSMPTCVNGTSFNSLNNQYFLNNC